MDLVTNNPQPFVDWLKERLRLDKIQGEENAQAYGFTRDSTIVGSFVFSEYTGNDVHMFCVAEDKRIFQRKYIRMMYDYCFNVMKVQRVSAMCNESNVQSRRLITGIGFKQEGRLRRYFGNEDALVYGLLQEDIRVL